jgi:hypothetical protein
VTSVSRVTASLHSTGVENLQPCLDAEVVIDETWAPRIQAVVTVPRGGAVLDLSATGGAIAVSLRLTRQALAKWTLADLTAAWDGSTLAELTTAWEGLTLADLTVAWEPLALTPAWRPAEVLDIDWLSVRSTTTDLVAGTITYELASHEALMQDSRGFDLHDMLLQSLAARLTTVLGDLGGLYAGPGWGAITESSYAGLLMPSHASAGLSTSLWELLEEDAGGLGLRIGCDVDGAWRLWNPTSAPTRTVRVARATSLTVTNSRADPWADRVVAKARAEDGVGADTSLSYESVPIPAWPNQTPRKTEVHEWDLGVNWNPAWPVQPAKIAARAAAAGTVMQVGAPIDLAMRPGVGISLDPPLPALTGVCASVRFHLAADPPTADMTVTTRSTVTTGA